MSSLNNYVFMLTKFLLILLLFDSKASSYHVMSTDCDDSEECDCGTIAEPTGTERIVKPHKDNDTFEAYNEDNEYKHDSQVWYRCIDRNNILVGNQVRKCNRGKWSGKVPRCAINYLNQTELALIEILDYNKRATVTTMYLTNRYNNFGAFTPPAPRHPNDCLKWKISEQQIWFFALRHYVHVQYIRIKLYAENLRHHWMKKEIRFKVFLNNIWGIKCKLSNTNSVNFEENFANKNPKNYLTLEFQCESDLKPLNGSKTHAIFVNFSAKKDIEIFTLSVCDLRVYHFPQSCGEPDYPVSAQVRYSALAVDFEQYEYICKDNDHILEGNTHIRCGPNGKWMDEFPICIPKSYCRALTNDTIGNTIQVKYESTKSGENGELFIPNGKMALFSCIGSENKNKNETNYQLHGITRSICRNGQWLGLNEKPYCGRKHSSSMSSTPISTSKQIIRILSGILIVCLISIVCLVVYMFAARKTRHKKKMEEIKSKVYSNDYRVNYDNSDDYDNHLYEHTINDYDYICDDMLQDNPLYRDDVSNTTECYKTNSIYSI